MRKALLFLTVALMATASYAQISLPWSCDFTANDCGAIFENDAGNSTWARSTARGCPQPSMNHGYGSGADLDYVAYGPFLTAGASAVRLTYDLIISSFADQVTVLYICDTYVDPNTTPAAWTVVDGPHTTAQNCTNHIVDISAVLGCSTQFWIAFRYVGTDLFYAAVDNINVLDPNAPTAVPTFTPTPLPGDTCATAVTINSGDCVLGTTAGASLNFDCGTAGGVAGGRDVVYTFTLAAQSFVEIRSESGADLDWAISTVCDATTGDIACADNGSYNPTSCGGAITPITYGVFSFYDLLPAGTYYIWVDTYGATGTGGDFALELLTSAETATCAGCPLGGIAEGEPVCTTDYVDAFNGGCNTTPTMFSSVTLGDTICGQSGTYLVGTVNNRDLDWYQVTVPAAANLTVEVTAQFPSLTFIYSAACPVGTALAAVSSARCEPYEVVATVAAGNYYVLILPAYFTDMVCGSASRYIATFSADIPSTPTPTPPPAGPGDACGNAIAIAIPGALPYSGIGATCGLTDDYNTTCLGSYDGGLDIIYQLNVSVATEVEISFTTDDDYTGILLDDACPPDPATCIDTATFAGTGGGTMGSNLLAAGTYYIMLDTWPAPACITEFTLNIEAYVPPTPCVTCPPGSTDENEPICGPDYDDTYNGGCNSTVPIFQPIACEETICGETGTFTFGTDGYRDTDWFQFTLTATSDVTFTAYGEFPILIGMSPEDLANCDTLPSLETATAAYCETATVTMYTLVPGNYWVIVLPQVFEGITCGTPYVATLTCAPAAPTPTPTVTPPPAGPGDTCGNPISINCGDCVLGTTVGMNNNFECGGLGAGADLVYTFTLTETQTITVLAEADDDLDFAVTDVCDASTATYACYDRLGTAAGAETTCGTAITADTWGYFVWSRVLGAGTYYIWIDTYAATGGANFALELLCAPGPTYVLECPAASQHSQAVDPLDPGFNAYGSDAGTTYTIYDDYSVTSPVCWVKFWGITNTPPIDTDITINFYADNAGAVGALTNSYPFTALTPVDTTWTFLSFPVYEYMVTLPTCEAQLSGWISIVGAANTSGFYWATSATGPGTDCFSYNGTTYTATAADVAFCLGNTTGPTPTPPPVPASGPVGLGVMVFAISALLGMSVLRKK